MYRDRELALGVKVFTRTEKLRQLLESIPPAIDVAYVADDGDEEGTAERQSLYDRDWPFDLELIDLPYDAGLGYGRTEIVDRLSEDYLLIVDSDHTVPPNVTQLVDVIESDPGLGGVSGLLFEYGDVLGTCQHLREVDDVLVRYVREDDGEVVDGVFYREFDFVPNVALFRPDCLADYCWDPDYVIGNEHIDFYLGHKRRTDWRFAVCPSVLFGHFPGGNPDYASDRIDPTKIIASKDRFREKWDIDQIVVRESWPTEDKGINGLRSHLPRGLDLPLWADVALEDLNERLWQHSYRIRGRLGLR